MGKKMNNAPIYYALVQVRFNPLAALGTYIPAIQEALRKSGFPDFRPVQITQIVFGANEPKTAVAPRYLFLNLERTSGFTLDQSFMTYNTTDYDNVDPFLSVFLKGLEIVHAEVALSYSDRVGIRFLDAVCPRPGETVSQYLQPWVMGLAEHLSDRELVHSISETRTALGKTTLVGRAIIHKQEKSEGAGFPEDLQPVPFQLIDKFSKVKGTYAIIDTDSWLEDRETFDLGALERTIRLLHENTRLSFDLMITPHALKVWE
jgi:uncharacterized protein (TIGR04255 family)